MQYIRLARELEGIYTDLLWLAETAQQVVRAAYTPVAATAPEVELVTCFRECPLVHEEPVWFTEAEYDCEEWVHCCSEASAALPCGAPRPRDSDRTAPSLAEACALPGLHVDSSPRLSESSPGPSQGEVPELVLKNTSGGSVAPVLDPAPSSA